MCIKINNTEIPSLIALYWKLIITDDAHNKESSQVQVGKAELAYDSGTHRAQGIDSATAHEGDLVSTHRLAFSLENSISCITLSKNSEQFSICATKKVG